MQDKPNSLPTNLIPQALVPVMSSICDTARDVADVIARGALGQALGQEVGATNSDGDGQKALDVLTDEMFADALARAGVRFYASEERDDVVTLNPDGPLAVAMDPLDGSSNIDVNVSIGSIFSIFEAAEDGEASVLRPASEQLAGGYVIYGPQTALVVTFGDGTQYYILDPKTGVFTLVTDRMEIPPQASEFAINASNSRHWHAPVSSYIDDCLAGTEGPHGRDFNMCWVGSLVAETHRIITRGGLFLYPADDRPGYEMGRLRMVYECAPIAFLVEQAGGKATDGANPLMQHQADRLHARVPLVFGSTQKVERVAEYHQRLG